VLRVVWVSVEGNPARFDIATRQMRASHKVMPPLGFYLCGLAFLVFRVLGFHPTDVLNSTWGGYGIVGVLLALWLTRGLDDDPRTERLHPALATESLEQRRSRRRTVALFYLGTVPVGIAMYLLGR
jgi:hypothetical protein